MINGWSLPWEVSTSRGGFMACTVERTSWSRAVTRPGCLLTLAAGTALLAWAAQLHPAFYIQLVAGGGVLLLGAAWGTVTSVELGSGPLTAVAAVLQRRATLEGVCQRRTTVLTDDALALADDDPAAAAELVELATERAVMEWPGAPDAEKIYCFLLCVVIEQARRQQRQRVFTPPRDAPRRPPAWRSLDPYERGIVRLIDTHRVELAEAAKMLDHDAAVVSADYSRCSRLLGQPQGDDHAAG
jgi:hypothetical protein